VLCKSEEKRFYLIRTIRISDRHRITSPARGEREDAVPSLEAVA
jgi:hypothetical protein